MMTLIKATRSQSKLILYTSSVAGDSTSLDLFLFFIHQRDDEGGPETPTLLL